MLLIILGTFIKSRVSMAGTYCSVETRQIIKLGIDHLHCSLDQNFAHFMPELLVNKILEGLTSDTARYNLKYIFGIIVITLYIVYRQAI